MSTILKALQRLEQERESLRPTGPTPVFSKAPPARGGLIGWLMTPWIRWGLVGCVIIALGATAFYFYRQSSPRSFNRRDKIVRVERRPPPVRAERKKIPPVASAPAAKAQPNPAGPDRSLPMGKPGADLAQTSPVTPSQPGSATQDHPRPILPRVSNTVEPYSQAQSGQAPAATTGTTRLPDRDVRSAKPADNPAAAAPVLPQAAGSAKAAPSNSAVKTSPVQEKKKPTNIYDNTLSLTDGRLKVQAIAWSAEPEDRMAVMNSRVVHEGDSVDDFIVVAIRPDDVVVREKGKGMWKVIFGKP